MSGDQEERDARLTPGKIIFPPEARHVAKLEELRPQYPRLIRYEDHAELDVIGTPEEEPPGAAGDRFIPDYDGELPVVYLSGDTEDIPEMRALKDIDAAFVCMNLPYTMDVEHAASAVLDFAPTVVYPTHYRGKDGMSDLERFRTLVAADPSIAVHMLDWY